MAEQQDKANTDSNMSSNNNSQSKPRDVAWYQKDLPEIPAAAREVLEGYSFIPADQINDHVYKVREKAWDVWPFPCIGGWRFLDLNLPTLPQYAEIISRVQGGEKLLDLGCCFGQELRRLIYDGAPGDKLYGADLQPDFFDLGYELFLDRECCKARFIAADLFEEPAELMALQGQISIIYAGAFFHLWDWENQLLAAKLVTKLLKPEPGSMLLGRQVGSVTPGLHVHNTNGDKPATRMFRHNEETWRELWKEAGKDMGVEWEVDVQLVDTYRQMPHLNFGDESIRQLRFCVRRL